ncbi:MAG: hypothetical protein QOG67_254 [Verrucomicrobiota bacterium]|jgi:hypothetical protein
MIGLLLLAREMVRGVQTPARLGLSAPSPGLNFGSAGPEKFMPARAPASAREGACAPRRVRGPWSVVCGQRSGEIK